MLLSPAEEIPLEFECTAMRLVRNEIGLNKVKFMIPFCRRINEAEKVLAAMAIHGISRGENDLGIYFMCEIQNTGLCGQAPSDYPDPAEFIVNQRINSISLNPDSLVKTRQLVAEVERRLKN